MALATGGLLKAIASMKPYGDEEGIQPDTVSDPPVASPHSADLSLHQLPLPTLQDPSGSPSPETTDPQSTTPTSQPNPRLNNGADGGNILQMPDQSVIPSAPPTSLPSSSSGDNPMFRPENHPMSEEIPGMTGLPGMSGGMGMGRPSPKVNLPAMSTMPSSARVGTLQGQLDQAMNPHPSLKERLLKTALRVGPAVAMMAMGGRGARQGAAEGLASGYQNDQTLREQRVKDLQAEVASAQRGQEAEYGTQTKAAEIEAQAENNRLIKEMMVGAQNTRATDRNNTTLMTHGIDPKTGKPTDALAASNQAKLDLMTAQRELAHARAAGEPQKLLLAQKNYQLAARRVAQGDQHLALDLDKFDYAQYKDTNPDMPTQATKTKIQQASAIHDVGANLEKKIDQYSNWIGPGSGRWTDLKTFLGDQSPEAQDLRGAIASYTALHPALHGFRGQSAYQHFFDAMGGKFATNAAAMKSGVQSLTNSADTAANAWRKGGNPANLPARRTAKPNAGPTGQPKVGDTKKFPNGNIGVYDGQGWVAQSNAASR